MSPFDVRDQKRLLRQAFDETRRRIGGESQRLCTFVRLASAVPRRLETMGATSPRSRGPHSKRFAGKMTRVSEARTRERTSVGGVGCEGGNKVDHGFVPGGNRPPEYFSKDEMHPIYRHDAAPVVFSTCACECVCACALYYYQGCNLLYII